MGDSNKKYFLFLSFHYFNIPQQKMRRDRSGQIHAETALKENQISMLKKELYVYKDLEQDFFKLNGQVADIEMKYAMVLDEKERVEGDWKKKLEINTNSAVQLKGDVEYLKKNVDAVTYEVTKAEGDNLTLLRICENKERQIENLQIALRELEKNYELEEEENYCLSEDLRGLKDERNNLEIQLDRLKKVLYENGEKFKQVERQSKQEENKIEVLSDMFTKLQIENCQLQKDLKTEELKVHEATQAYSTLCLESDDLSLENQKLEGEIRGCNKELKELMSQLESLQNENAHKDKHLKEVEKKLWTTEEELDQATRTREENKKINFKLANENESLNNSIDSALLEIMELESINKVLQQQIQNYLCVDEQARLLLDRRKKMTELLGNVSCKLEASGSSSIAHLR